MKRILMLGLLSLTFAVGCAKKSDDSGNVGSRAPRGNNGQYMFQQGYQGQARYQPGGAGYYTASVGKVYSNAQYASAFSQAMRGLVSATIDQEYIGSIDAATGVSFRGYVDFTSNGQINTGTSSIAFEVRDSYSQSGGASPIYLNLQATSGWVSNGQADLVFQDSYGWVRLQGTYQGGNFYGKMSYQNSSSYGGHSGENLDFQIETCGFFKCQ